MNMATNRFAKVSNVLLILASVALIFCAGGYIGQVIFKPQVIIEPEIRTKFIDRVIPIPVEKVVEKEIYIPVEKVVVQNIETYKPLRHFQDLYELERWLGQEVLFVGIDVVDERTGKFIKRWECVDYAIRLQEKALEDGYIMSFEVIHHSEHNSLFKQKIPYGSSHAINSVIIGNEIYYIEPQNHEIAFVTNIGLDP